MRHSKIGFYGGVGSVTGANFLFDSGGAKFLVDCGMVQGDRFAETINSKEFPYDPAIIDVLLVTHAHSDHIGRIPKLVKDGFKGKIYSTEPTRALAAVMLEDALSVMIFEEQRFGTPRLYEMRDIETALSMWQTVEYGERLMLSDDVVVTLSNAGHILGSAFIAIERDGRKLVFSGDIGNNPQPLMSAPDVPAGYHYLVMESVYGDRSHEEVEERSDLLLHHIEQTIVKNGTLIIPAFSLERTQILLLEINNLVERGKIQPVSVFLDSPLAIAVTDIYRERTKHLREEIRRQIESGDDIFDFPKLKFTRTVADSRAIAKVHGPKIIIAGSGMSHGGRIQGHEKHFLEDINTTLLLVGYQSVGSLGRRLQDGAKRVRIDNQDVKVRAKVATIHGWSGHADREQLIDFVAKGGEKIERVFVTMGEERSALFLVQRLRDYLGTNAVAPAEGDVIDLDL
ncbi:hypothetical protein A2837_02545 [Candidatus Kaiserbacteria bacterium RIFCSPHIGHO2_01_FULL_46_22]|uniref:MBL fold hydrolase n=1 Tax=Candidatus Kaiserbacteria bacterium RIFCSPHIGHO2_01_FULL_46_22 TaxID=1798475 RepID=A0A1F6BX29_9BACT|nr:MAG: hypothetical protein A2837_02545 [Candidatus Kaiserbacteria bacterium RIFCSPHIGHO2_01_FULL_46_22]